QQNNVTTSTVDLLMAKPQDHNTNKEFFNNTVPTTTKYKCNE
ncbi:5200_t:CDS:1, partial [Racocetra fulgida]